MATSGTQAYRGYLICPYFAQPGVYITKNGFTIMHYAPSVNDAKKEIDKLLD